MANTSYAGGGYSISTTTDSFRSVIGKINQILAELGNSIVTTALTSAGAPVTGNAYVFGILGADTLVANTGLRGGNTSVSNTLTISSNVATIYSVNALAVNANVFSGNVVTATINVATTTLYGNVIGSTVNASSNVTTSTMYGNVVAGTVNASSNVTTTNVYASNVISNTYSITAWANTLTTNVASGNVASFNIFNGAIGANIASTSTLNLDTATGDYVIVTGTTTINNVALTAGRSRWVEFAANVQLSNSGNIIIPANNSYVVSPGDVVQFRAEANSSVKISSYLGANGAPGAGGGGVTPNYTIDAFTSGVNFTAGTSTTLGPLSGQPFSNSAIMLMFDGLIQGHDQWNYYSANSTIVLSSAIPVGVSRAEVYWAGSANPYTGALSNFNVYTTTNGVGFTAGSSTSVTLGSAPASAYGTQVFFDGIVQHHNTWSLSGATVNFTSTIPAYIQTIEVQYAGAAVVGIPNAASVGPAQLSATGTPTANTVLAGNNTWTSTPVLSSVTANTYLDGTSTFIFSRMNRRASQWYS